MTGHRLAILGCGIMGEAIVGGLLRAAIFRADEIVATARRPEAAEGLGERHGVAVTLDNLAACRSADTVLLTLKPQRIAKVLHQPGMREALAGKLVISIAAGVTLTQLADWLPDSAVIRAMPNTPCLIDEGMTVLARGPKVGDAEVAAATRLFETVGRCIEVEDKLMDAVTGLGGSGPAFVYIMIEAMADGGHLTIAVRAVDVDDEARAHAKRVALACDRTPRLDQRAAIGAAGAQRGLADVDPQRNVFWEGHRTLRGVAEDAHLIEGDLLPNRSAAQATDSQ